MGDDAEYDRLTRFCAIVAQTVWPAGGESPLEALAAVKRAYGAAKARQGLNMAINDFVEMGENFTAADVAALDARLSAHDTMTFSEARARFSRGLKVIMRRGRIENEEEYHLVRNAVELVDETTAKRHWQLTNAFESEAGANG